MFFAEGGAKPVTLCSYLIPAVPGTWQRLTVLTTFLEINSLLLLFSLQACPMNMQPHADPLKTPQEIWEDFSLSFTPAVREVVEFAKHIPGFSALSQNDQVALLKAGTFEVQ